MPRKAILCRARNCLLGAMEKWRPANSRAPIPNCGDGSRWPAWAYCSSNGGGTTSEQFEHESASMNRAAVLVLLPLGLLCLASLLVLSSGCTSKSERQVVVYTSQDREYAEPIFREFTRRTGIKVNALYDSEAAKTVGLANRLLAEKSHPQCDVFWNNEELRTWQLAAKNVVETNWLSLGYRARRLVLNTNHLSLQIIPLISGDGKNLGLRDLAISFTPGKVALAYPLFGTTATHFMALRQYWGEKKWEQWCRALHSKKPFLVDGNSAVVNLVGRGEAWVGLTDSDDIAAGQREGLPVA